MNKLLNLKDNNPDNTPNRLVTVTGFTGIGKSSLVCSTVHYLQDRNKFKGGCIYVNARGINSYQKFIDSLLSNLVDGQWSNDFLSRN
jgi:Cdc6-like AAA superfamily ATPase